MRKTGIFVPMSHNPNQYPVKKKPVRTGVFAAFVVAVLLSGVPAIADPAPFEGFRKIETDHFIFVFEPEYASSAEHLAGIAEEVYEQITSFYNSYPDSIYCVVDGRQDLYSNYYSPLPAHIRITVQGPTWPMFGPRTDDWLELVFTHELTHYVQLNYQSGVFHTLASVFGPGLHAIQRAFLPTWAVEGPGVLAETLFTSGGRGDSEHFEALWTAVAEDFFGYCRAGSSTVFEPEQRPYVAGYLIYEHIMRVYGAEAVKEIHREFVKFPVFGPGRAFRKVTGRSARAVFSDVVDEVKLDAARRTAANKANYRDSRRITPEVYGDYFLPQATGRGWITYRYTHDLAPALVLFDPDTGDEEILITRGLTDPSSFSADPSGSTVVYSSNSTTQTAAGRAVYSDVYLLDTGTGQEERVTSNERLWHPAINPADGSLVAVTGSGNESFLVSVNRQNGETQVLFRKNASTIFNPVFSEDGRRLYFTMNVGGMQDIWALPYPLETMPMYDEKRTEVNDEAAVPVTGPDRNGEFFPRLSDGELVYASDRGGNLAVYTKAPEGDTSILVAHDPVGAYAGFIDDDGDVVYAAYTETGYALKRISAGHSGLAATDSGRTETTRPSAQRIPASARSAPSANPESERPADARPPGTAVSHEYAVFYDLPGFLLWAPVPVLSNNDQLNIGAGVYTLAGSILNGNTISAAVMYDLLQMGPVFDLNGTIRYRRTMFGYDFHFSEGKDETGTGFHFFDAGVSAGFPLIQKRRFPYREDMRLYGAVGIAGGSTAYATDADIALSYAIARGGALKDFFDPLKLSLWTSATAELPLSPLEAPALVLRAGGYGQFPSIVRHQVAGVGLHAQYAGAGELQLTAAIDYKFHIALLDLPLPYGYSVNHLAGGVYVESRAAPGASGFQISPYVYPGIEIIAKFGSAAHTPVGIGARFRIRPGSLSEFNLLTDSYLYLTSGRGGFPNRPLAAPLR